MFLEKNWALVVGVLLGALTLFFLMGLVVITVVYKPIPDSSKVIVITIIAFGLAFSSAFIGGNAVAKGRLPLVSEEYSFQFSAAGGVATFLIVFVLGHYLYTSTTPVRFPWNQELSTLDSAGLRLSNVDDSMAVKINGQPVAQASYGQAPAEVDVLKLLQRGNNDIDVEIKNGAYGGCSGELKLVVNGEPDSRFQWAWSNAYAAANSTCFNNRESLQIK